MKFWNTYKVWLLIGLTYTGFYFLKGLKNLMPLISYFHSNFIFEKVKKD